MKAIERINKEFERLVALGHKKVLGRPLAEQVILFVVVARCEADINGFESIYEQALTAADLKILIEGLHRLGEEALATDFAAGLQALMHDGFYEHHSWKKVSKLAKRQIVEIGERIGEKLWGLDEKLVLLLDDGAPPAE